MAPKRKSSTVIAPPPPVEDDDSDSGPRGDATLSDGFWSKAGQFLSDKSDKWEEELGDDEEEAYVI